MSIWSSAFGARALRRGSHSLCSQKRQGASTDPGQRGSHSNTPSLNAGMSLVSTYSRRITAATGGTADGVVSGSCVHGGRLVRAAR